MTRLVPVDRLDTWRTECPLEAKVSHRLSGWGSRGSLVTGVSTVSSRSLVLPRLMSFRFVALLLALAVAFGVIAGPAPARAADAATGAGGLFVSQSGRLFDTATRAGNAPASATAANRWYPVQVGGVAGIPANDVSAVTVSFTVQNPSAFGVVRADASGVTTPNTTTGYLSYSANLPTASNTAVPGSVERAWVSSSLEIPTGGAAPA